MFDSGGMVNKTVIVTGGSSGIGLSTAMILASKDAQLILVSDSEAALKNALQSIKKETGNNKVEFFVADLTSQKAIHNLALVIKEKYDSIDILINNAGAVFSKFEFTEDGLEKTIALNYFAPYLLTHLLLDNLKKSEGARIINVTSRSHFDGKIDLNSFTSNYAYSVKKVFLDFSSARLSLKLLFLFMGHFLMTAYAQSKLANVIFTIDLSEKLKGNGITVNCLHPGFVNTAIGKKNMPWYSQFFWYFASVIGGINAYEGAATSVYLATSKEVEGITGKYFENCRITKPADLVFNTELRKQLLDKTIKCIRVE